jgi:uncharacterized protein YxjI
MGFLRDRDRDGTVGTRYRMRQHLLSIGDDYWIEAEDGRRAFRVDGKALRVRRDVRARGPFRQRAGQASGAQAERARQDGDRARRPLVALVKKALIGFRDRFSIEVEHGADLDAKGNLVDHEYEIKRDGDTIATVSKRWFRVRDTYGVEIAEGEDEPLVLAITVCIDAMSHPRE